MNPLPKVFFIVVGLLFSVIGLIAYFKADKAPDNLTIKAMQPIEISLGNETRVAVASPLQTTTKLSDTPPIQPNQDVAPLVSNEKLHEARQEQRLQASAPVESALPDEDRMAQLFNKDGPLLPIVETIVYKSRVSWQKGRPAWLSDYASHYHTSRHFIARSLNGTADYLKQDLNEGARFNVLRLDKNIQFHLLIDISRCKLWFYYEDVGARERVLLKTYDVCLGRVDGSKLSGCLTPLGKYTIGNKTAVYKPHFMGPYHGENIEMMTVFGTRWIPFDKEVENCSAPPKGYGLHGVPWVAKGSKKVLQEDCSSLGKHESDGCVRMASKDIEEIFAIIITKPTTVELVKDFYDAKLPPGIIIVK